MVHRIFVSIIFLVMAAGAAFAQSNTGEIAGTVHDPQGAVVPGATITITNTATGLIAHRDHARTTARFASPRCPRGFIRSPREKSGFAVGESRAH